MKFLVVGHSVEDNIHRNGRDIHAPGGIIYTVLGMKNFMDYNDQLFLMTAIDDNTEHLFSFVYDDLNHKYFSVVKNIPAVHLYIVENSERWESYDYIPESMDVSVIEDINSFDGVLVNMITGFDISLDSLKKMREGYNGLIYMDIHTLSRGVGKNKRRAFRLIPDVEEWVASVDIIQANENEIRTLSSKNNELEIINDILHLGLQVLIVTRGKDGNSVYWLEDGEVREFSQKAVPGGNINTVGCGDVFGAVFFYSYIKDRNLEQAARTANAAAGCVTEYSDISRFINLKNDTFTRLN